MAERPYCCPDRTCEPIYACGYEGEHPGQSWECYGRMSAERVFTYDGEEHRNDLNRCVYTPLKGVIRFQENAQDWALWVYATETALCELTGRQDMKADRWRWLKLLDRLGDSQSPGDGGSDGR